MYNHYYHIILNNRQFVAYTGIVMPLTAGKNNVIFAARANWAANKDRVQWDRRFII